MRSAKATLGRGADPERTKHRILTVRAVSSKAGVTAPSIYWHFGSMDELRRQVMDRAFQRLLVALAAAPEQSDPLVRLGAAARIYRDFGIDHPRVYQTMFIAPDANSGLLIRRDETAGRRAFAHLEGVVAACLTHRRISDLRPQPTAIAIWSFVHGMVALQLAGRLGMSRAGFDRFFDESLAVLLRGFGLT